MVTGHLTEADAKIIADTIVGCIDHKPVLIDDLYQFQQMTKLPDDSVNSYSETNPLPEGDKP